MLFSSSGTGGVPSRDPLRPAAPVSQICACAGAGSGSLAGCPAGGWRGAWGRSPRPWVSAEAGRGSRDPLRRAAGRVEGRPPPSGPWAYARIPGALFLVPGLGACLPGVRGGLRGQGCPATFPAQAAVHSLGLGLQGPGRPALCWLPGSGAGPAEGRPPSPRRLVFLLAHGRTPTLEFQRPRGP